MPKLTIDGKKITAPDGMTLLQICEEAGIEIPRFCYHERLSVAGNCRMCLVEVEKNPKLVASCAQPVMENMVVHTNSAKVVEGRKGVMEFLLINHPLDCPICDQGGECDLQDQALVYGGGQSRFAENKRAVEEKYLGPLIKTRMTRCIHCTRCIRFAEEVAGAPELGAIGRGEDMEITPYLSQLVHSELSGNMIDLCPVGALTSRPYVFQARPWELRRTETIDVMDAAGSHIRVDARGREIMRVLPRRNDDINEEWISDKTRFAYDGLKYQRLDRPYVRENGRLREASWSEAFSAAAAAFKQAGARAGAIAGDLACVESMHALKDLMRAMGSPHTDCRQDGAALPTDKGRGGWLFNSTIAGIDEADAILLIGVWPRLEAPVVNARIRKRWLAGDCPIGFIGEAADMTYPVEQLGADAQALAHLLAGEHKFAKTLAAAKKPMLILGMGALTGKNGAAIYDSALALAYKIGALGGKDWNGFNIFHNAAARAGGMDAGFLPAAKGWGVAEIMQKASLVYLLHADELEASKLDNAFVIYQGSHGDKGAALADVIFPAAAWTEKNALWVNMEGRVQESLRAVFPPGDAREDWTIIRAFSDYLGCTLPYDTHASLRASLPEHFAFIGAAPRAETPPPRAKAAPAKDALAPPWTDFYLTNPIARTSKTMAACSRAALQKEPA